MIYAMHFKTYFFDLSLDERKVFATKVGTSVGHLNNIAYGNSSANPALSLAIERQTKGVVKRIHLRPADAHLIWPDVKQVKPKVQVA